MHSVAHRHHLQHARGKRFNEKTTAWQKDKRLSKIEQFQLELEMENRAYIEKQISSIGKEVAKMSHRTTLGRGYDLPHAAAWFWSDHGDDDPGCDW
jgi:hypothetical protein